MRQAISLSLATALALASASAIANPFPDADLDQAEEKHMELCVQCHMEKFGGEGGSNIYTRPDRRVTTPSGLAQQLTACTTMLNLDLFPEDEHHLAGFLNKHFYKFE